MGKPERQFFGAKLDPAVWNLVKRAAPAAGKPMWQFIEDALRKAAEGVLQKTKVAGK